MPIIWELVSNCVWDTIRMYEDKKMLMLTMTMNVRFKVIFISLTDKDIEKCPITEVIIEEIPMPKKE